MSVDMKVFEEMSSAFGDVELDKLVYLLCEGDFDFGKEYVFENPHPEYSLRKSDEVEYNRLYDARRIERTGPYNEFIKSQKELWRYEDIEQEGGGEGGGEYCYGVFKLKGKFYKAEYSYFSYAGHDYDGISRTLKEVRPVEKTIVVYE